MPERILQNSGPLPPHRLFQAMEQKYGKSRVPVLLNSAMKAGTIENVNGMYRLPEHVELEDL